MDDNLNLEKPRLSDEVKARLSAEEKPGLKPRLRCERDEAMVQAEQHINARIGQDIAFSVLRKVSGLNANTLHSILSRMIIRGEAERLGFSAYRILAPLASKKKGIIHCAKCAEKDARIAQILRDLEAARTAPGKPTTWR